MKLRAALQAGLPALSLAGCSSSDDPMGPGGPDPVLPPEIQDFSIADADGIITHGDFTTLRWTAPGAAEISILPIVGQGLAPQGGTVSIRPHAPTTYVIVVRNSQGTARDSVHVDIRYRPGVYVKANGGDDAAAGTDITTPVATLAEALSRTGAGGTIFLAAGTYAEPLAITGAQVSVYGGLDPVTYFEGQPASLYRSNVRPASGVPLSVRDTPGIMEISNVVFDARDTESVAAEVVDAQARLLGCTLDARSAAVLSADGAAALRIVSTGPGANVEARGCRIFGPRQVSTSESRGVSVEQATAAVAANLLLANCFVDGGRGDVRSSGVYVDSFGTVDLGMCTIGAETLVPGLGQDTPAAIRIARGSPRIGGNILFTRGGGQRWGIQETSTLANPSTLEGNLFISVGGTPYDNFDTFDPSTQAELQLPLYTIEPNVTVGDNLLVNQLSITQIVADVDAQDYHLKPVAPGVANPAVDTGLSWVGKPEYGSAVLEDIDGDNRPNFFAQWDRGADESN
jgi:hypothetical protein